MESNESGDSKFVEKKELEFAEKDNIHPKLTSGKYLEKYICSDLREVFFYDFSHLLMEWLLILKENHPTNRISELEWNIEEIAKLQQENNKFTRTVDFWLESIVVGFITEFVVDTAQSYTEAKKYFLKGLRGRYIRSLYTSINILLYKNGMMTMELEN
jgi:hypothetical protein